MKRLRLVFAWYDLWVGAYYDRSKHHLYLMVPMAGVRIDLSRARAICPCVHTCQQVEGCKREPSGSGCTYIRGYGMVHVITCTCTARNHATGGGCACIDLGVR